MTTIRFKTILFWGGLLGGVVVAYYPALFTYFSQDDFTHLVMSQAKTFGDIVNFFRPPTSAIFYRPLSIQLYTFVGQLLFGTNPFGYHVVALVTHLANVYLVFRLLGHFVKDKTPRYVAAFIYGIHPVHFMSLFWIAEFSMVLAPFFAFLAMDAFLDQRFYRFLLFLLLGLLSNELVVAVPLILLLWVLVKRTYKQMPWLIPAFFLVGGLVWVRFFLVPTSLDTQYVLSITPLVFLSNLKWQLIRAIGLPEGFMAYTGSWGMQMALAAILGFWLVWIRSVNLKTLRKYFSLLLFAGGWFGLALLPVGFLIQHQSPIYQIIGLPGFLLGIILGLKPRLSVLRVYLLAGLFFISAFWGIRSQIDYHWVTQRARSAKYHLQKVFEQQPRPGETVVFINTLPESSRQVYFALGAGKAIEAFFGKEVAVQFEDFTGVIPPDHSVYILSRRLE
ncbi:MAG: hypothetical protein HYS86_04570 [Candidatus Chisholmbacteria bacterium]|nr:hypothetical protein [Candidatus Chisholmbacteria bacterium]